jgi:hypothetical protein
MRLTAVLNVRGSMDGDNVPTIVRDDGIVQQIDMHLARSCSRR